MDPRLLVQMSRSGPDRRAESPEGDCLILSDDDLASFDSQRVDEVRDALSNDYQLQIWPDEDGGSRRRLRRNRVVLTAVLFALALGMGMTIGVVF